VLSLSIIALFIGPIIYQWLRHGGFIAKAFDSLIVAILVLLMAFLLIPESWHELGYLSVGLILAGYLVPGLLEHLVKKAAHAFHLASLMIALAGLAIHALMDGAALFSGAPGHSDNLSLAIVLHRFGVGMMLWMMVRPAFGKRVAYAVLGFVSLLTVAGYLLPEALLGMEAGAVMPIIQALIIGMIVHSLVHSNHGAGHRH
jgi:hypothetical protein